MWYGKVVKVHVKHNNFQFAAESVWVVFFSPSGVTFALTHIKERFNGVRLKVNSPTDEYTQHVYTCTVTHTHTHTQHVQ